MTTSTAKGRVRVRGTCKAGHTTEATSDPGRVTWSGVCASDGCELPVKARRVPADTPAPPADVQTPDLEPDNPKPKRVDYAKQPPRQRAPEPPAGSGDEPTDEPEHTTPAGPLQRNRRPEPDAAGDDAEQPRGLRQRLADRQRVRRAAGTRYEFNPFG